jgi:hypothetical protein
MKLNKMKWAGSNCAWKQWEMRTNILGGMSASNKSGLPNVDGRRKQEECSNSSL